MFHGGAFLYMHLAGSLDVLFRHAFGYMEKTLLSMKNSHLFHMKVKPIFILVKKLLFSKKILSFPCIQLEPYMCCLCFGILVCSGCIQFIQLQVQTRILVFSFASTYLFFIVIIFILSYVAHDDEAISSSCNYFLVHLLMVISRECAWQFSSTFVLFEINALDFQLLFIMGMSNFLRYVGLSTFIKFMFSDLKLLT